MSKSPDDLEALRTIVDALREFDVKDQERIMRWTREKLELPPATQTPGSVATPPAVQSVQPSVEQPHRERSASIREFIASRNPRSENQLAATVAYYFRFEAPESQRKEAIGSADLQDACRQAGRARLKNPAKTLIHAHDMGLLDKAERGLYAINAVGENLVAMTLPAGGPPASAGKRSPSRRRSSSKTVSKKQTKTRKK